LTDMLLSDGTDGPPPQVSNYLDDNMGHVAFIVSRKAKLNITTHQLTQKTKHNNIILQITDVDLKKWVTEVTCLQQLTGEQIRYFDPVTSIQNMYSDIITF